MINLGLSGFNVLEQCCIVRWGKDNFPNIKVSFTTNPQQAEQMAGLVLDCETYLKWQGELSPVTAILLLTENCKFKQTNPNVTVMLTTRDPYALEANIGLWLQGIEQPGLTMRNTKRTKNPFSAREVQVLNLLNEGASNIEIANALEIQVSTVKTYLRRIYERMGALNRTHAVSLYKANQ